MTDDDLDDQNRCPPPSAVRVARRVAALACVCCRGHLEAFDSADEAEDFRDSMLGWADESGLLTEFEPDETEWLDTPYGELDPEVQDFATWLCEGAVILAWALGVHEFPAHDSLAEPSAISKAIGFMDGDATGRFATARLRPASEFEVASDRLFAIHWRLRDFKARPGSKNFGRLAETVSFGPLDIRGLPLGADGDMTIDARPLCEVDDVRLEETLLAAYERHRAISWLLGSTRLYSEVDTSI